jgi:hypothetical protein
MIQIESQQNPRLKALRRLQARRERVRSGRFLAEGEDLIASSRSKAFGSPARGSVRRAFTRSSATRSPPYRRSDRVRA